MNCHAKAPYSGPISALIVGLVAALVLALTPALAAAAPPVPSAEATTDVGYTTAKANGTVDPADHESFYFFQYASQARFETGGWDGFAGFSTLPENAGAIPVSAQLTDLAPNTLYHVRLMAGNNVDDEVESIAASTFTTKAVAAPEVSIDPVTAITATSAHFSGEVDTDPPDPSDPAFDANWSFSCTPVCFETDSGTVLAADGTGSVATDAVLQPNTSYTVTLKATNKGNSDEASESFSTPAVPPTASTLPATKISDTAATIRGKLNPRNSPTEYWFEWGAEDCSTSSCASVPASEDADAGSGNSTVFASRPLSGLQPSTTYHYRLLAKNAEGTVASEDATFATTTTAVPESSCPNAGKVGVGLLPDCRAWEMVSPPDKNGGLIIFESSRTRAAVDGSAVQFSSLQAFGDVVGTGVAADYIAERSSEADPGDNGWSTHAITPQQEQLNYFNFATGGEPRYLGQLSDDLEKGVFLAWSPLTDAPNVAETYNLYRRDDLRTPGAGSYRLLTDSPFPLPMYLPPQLVGASEDFDHVVLHSKLPFTEDAEFDKNNVYEWDQGSLRLANILPNGATAPGSVGGGGIGIIGDEYTAHPISADGSRIFFMSAETEGDIYVRINGRSTVQLNAPGPARYWDSSADGSRVFFTTPSAGVYMWEQQDYDEQQSVAVDANGGSFTLTFNEASTAPIASDASAAKVREELEALVTVKPGNVAVSGGPGGVGAGTPYLVTFTGDFAGANVAEMSADGSSLSGGASSAAVTTTQPVENLTQLNPDHPGEPLNQAMGVIGASRDGSYVYFVSLGQLVPGAPPIKEPGIFLWHEGEISYVSKMTWEDDTSFLLDGSGSPWGIRPKQAHVTPDGRHLMLISTNGKGLLSAHGGDDYDHGGGCADGDIGCKQLYVYSADKDELTCVSCKLGGGTATGEAQARSWGGYGIFGASFIARPNLPLTDDGRYAFFSSSEKLVPSDNNGQFDAYVYDLVKDEARLLSSGEDALPSYFMDATPDGKDVFFATAEPLTGWDIDNTYDIYDARVGGGFPEPLPPPPSCQGDACQPAPQVLNDPTPSSATAQGPGNEKPKRKPPCPKGKHRVKAANGKSHCVKKRGSKNKRNANSNRRAGR